MECLSTTLKEKKAAYLRKNVKKHTEELFDMHVSILKGAGIFNLFVPKSQPNVRDFPYNRLGLGDEKVKEN